MKAASLASAALGFSLAALLAVGALWAIDAGGVRSFLREHALDVLQRRAAPPDTNAILVVDIDSASLSAHGAWPWSRAALGKLVDKLADGEPAVIGLDMLLAGEDRFSPAAVARRLAGETGRADLAAISSELVDGDALLARAIARAPTVLGAVLASEAKSPFHSPAPILVRGAPALPDLWGAAAAIGPNASLAQPAAGIGLIVFDNDPDGVARRIPMLAIAGAEPLAGFAVETLRVAREASTLIVEDAPARLTIGDIVAPLSPDASLRFRATSPASWEKRTISALRVLEEHFDVSTVKGKIVLIGASAPEVGLLRRTAEAEAAASVQIEADAIATLLSKAIPVRSALMARIETTVAFMLGLFALVAGIRLRPARGVMIVAALMTAWALLAGLIFHMQHVLLDPAGPAAVAGVVFTVAAIASAVETERRERRLRDRFEQHLAPAVVARILANPKSLRMEGEARDVTAMFTDIEGFTSMTERAEPRELVALLNAYFQMLTDIVVAHGGMVDKIVGDGIHALFNAPLDLPDHSRHAVDCALALRAACAIFRERPDARALGLGRTRIGLEAGPVIIGDIGGKRKLDYTAHGTAINTAARMEAANKELGTTICIGPVAASRLAPETVRSLGKLSVRGRSDPLEVFGPTAS